MWSWTSLAASRVYLCLLPATQSVRARDRAWMSRPPSRSQREASCQAQTLRIVALLCNGACGGCYCDIEGGVGLDRELRTSCRTMQAFKAWRGLPHSRTTPILSGEQAR